MCCAIPGTACRMQSWKQPVDCTTFETRTQSGGPKPNENLIPDKVYWKQDIAVAGIRPDKVLRPLRIDNKPTIDDVRPLKTGVHVGDKSVRRHDFSALAARWNDLSSILLGKPYNSDMNSRRTRPSLVFDSAKFSCEIVSEQVIETVLTSLALEDTFCAYHPQVTIRFE